jgi:hypothetical protein
MKRSHSLLIRLVLVVGIIPICIGVMLISSWLYTTNQLRLARAAGVYASAEEGMNSLIAKSYIEPDNYQIMYAGPDSFDGSSPHVWYVIACVWGGHRVDGSPTGSEKHNWDQPGSFFLNTKDGWVYMSEGAFPGLIGSWMDVFGLAGPGSSQPTHDWGSPSQRGCDF